MDALQQFKESQKVAWAGFAVLEQLTGTAAPALVRFARVAAGANALDVACGTGVVAFTAARAGARVTGVDLTPELVSRAKENAALIEVEASFVEGDVEALPFGDARFDFVVSQFGHMFAPRPEVAIREMLRVLKPGGTIAFSTWPPELFTGRTFGLFAKYAPPPPPGVSSPAQWGDPNIVRERLGAAVKDITFARDTMRFPALSPRHARIFFEKNLGMAQRLFAALDANDPPKAAALRSEFEELASTYFEDNIIRQDFLMTRAVKA